MKNKTPKYYHGPQKEAIKRYREKRRQKTAQVIYLASRDFILQDCLDRYGLSAPAFLRLLIENDYNGLSFNIPNIKKEDVGKWIEPVFEAKAKATPDICLKILGSLNGNDMAAIGALCQNAGGVPPAQIIMEMAGLVSSHVTYVPGEILLRCFEADGGSRETFLGTLSSCGIHVYEKFFPRKIESLSGKPGRKKKTDIPEEDDEDGDETDMMAEEEDLG